MSFAAGMTFPLIVQHPAAAPEANIFGGPLAHAIAIAGSLSQLSCL